MPLNASGPISIGGSTTGESINLELGRSATASSNLNETDLRILAGVVSGAISLSDFYGKSNVVIDLLPFTIPDFSGGSRAATAGYRLTSGGQVDQLINATYSNLDQWCTPTSQASNYEVLVNNVTGDLIGTTGSWLALSTTRVWSLYVDIGGNKLATFDVTIRRVGTSTTYGPVTIELEVDAQF